MFIESNPDCFYYNFHTDNLNVQDPDYLIDTSKFLSPALLI